ncbi:hypothetical protein AS25_07725 [Kocuria marina]|uniref:Uncharacterized protein n=1 Tax=Kocuria marina TaxID=223184 RepID=A0A0B0DG74_9MICC|nr:hypothetical protein AS25_07725 [Kocuria marina]
MGICESWARYTQLPSKMCFISSSKISGSVKISRLARMIPSARSSSTAPSRTSCKRLRVSVMA